MRRVLVIGVIVVVALTSSVVNARKQYTTYNAALQSCGKWLENRRKTTNTDWVLQAVERPASLVPGDRTGCEGIGPEDTFDGDYGRLLDAVHGKGVASPTGLATEVPIGGPLPVAA